MRTQEPYLDSNGSKLKFSIGDVSDGVDVWNVGSVFLINEDLQVLGIRLNVDCIETNFVRASITSDGEQNWRGEGRGKEGH